MSRRARPLLALALTLATPAAAEIERGREPTVTAAGGLCFIDDPALEGEGFMRARLAAPVSPRLTAAGWFEARTSIRGADGVTFEIRDVRYRGGLALERAVHDDLALLAVAEVWGKEAVDAQGSAQATLLGLGARAALGSLESTVSLGGVLHARELEADAWGRIEARWRHPLGAGLRAGIDADLRVLDGDGRRSDLSAGPSLEVPWGDLQLRLFAAYLRQRTPLGLGLSGVALGIAFEDPSPDRLREAEPPLSGGDVSGAVAVGLGDGRRSGRLAIAAVSPAWRDRWRLAADVDGNVLTAADPGDLFYHYAVGVERLAARPDSLAGLWFYHRSNHRPGEPGSVTSWDVVETGVDLAPEGRWGRLSLRARAGALLDSSFGEDRRWHARARLRYTAPRCKSRSD